MSRVLARHVPFVLLAAVLLAADPAAAIRTGEIVGCVLADDALVFAHARECFFWNMDVARSFLDRVDVAWGSIEHAAVQRASIYRTHVADSLVADALLVATDVSNATLTGVTIHDGDLEQVFLSHAALNGTSVAHATIEDSTLDEATYAATVGKDVRLCRVAIVDADGGARFDDSGCEG